MGGFEYVTDLLIGPRPATDGTSEVPFRTQHGDSGTLWLLEPPKGQNGQPLRGIPLRPIALQWGGFVFTDSAGRTRQPFALGTLLSTVCQMLEVDFVRDWGLSLPEYWGPWDISPLRTWVAISLDRIAPNCASSCRRTLKT